MAKSGKNPLQLVADESENLAWLDKRQYQNDL